MNSSDEDFLDFMSLWEFNDIGISDNEDLPEINLTPNGQNGNQHLSNGDSHSKSDSNVATSPSHFKLNIDRPKDDNSNVGMPIGQNWNPQHVIFSNDDSHSESDSSVTNSPSSSSLNIGQLVDCNSDVGPPLPKFFSNNESPHALNVLIPTAQPILTNASVLRNQRNDNFHQQCFIFDANAQCGRSSINYRVYAAMPYALYDKDYRRFKEYLNFVISGDENTSVTKKKLHLFYDLFVEHIGWNPLKRIDKRNKDKVFRKLYEQKGLVYYCLSKLPELFLRPVFLED